METKIENFALEPVLKKFEQLASEKISLGVKNRIKKITSKLTQDYNSYNESHVELLMKHGATKDDDNKVSLAEDKITPEFQAEYLELANLTNTVTFDAIDFKMIEKLETENDYLTLLAPFFENLD
jgi:cobalamin biosynthesis Co2+ chelatase CbiK